MPPEHIAEVLFAASTERKQKEAAADRVELVWTGPETPGSQSRDTSVVVRVLLFLNVPPPPGTQFDPDEVARTHFREFLKKNWPATREPELYYDRRALAKKGDARGGRTADRQACARRRFSTVEAFGGLPAFIIPASDPA